MTYFLGKNPFPSDKLLKCPVCMNVGVIGTRRKKQNKLDDECMICAENFHEDPYIVDKCIILTNNGNINVEDCKCDDAKIKIHVACFKEWMMRNGSQEVRDFIEEFTEINKNILKEFYNCKKKINTEKTKKNEDIFFFNDNFMEKDIIMRLLTEYELLHNKQHHKCVYCKTNLITRKFTFLDERCTNYKLSTNEFFTCSHINCIHEMIMSEIKKLPDSYRISLLKNKKFKIVDPKNWNYMIKRASSPKNPFPQDPFEKYNNLNEQKCDIEDENKELMEDIFKDRAHLELHKNYNSIIFIREDIEDNIPVFNYLYFDDDDFDINDYKYLYKSWQHPWNLVISIRKKIAIINKNNTEHQRICNLMDIECTAAKKCVNLYIKENEINL